MLATTRRVSDTVREQTAPVKQLVIDHAVPYTVLRWGLGVLMFLAGFHKFFNQGDWLQYVAPWVIAAWPLPLDATIIGVGALEVVAGMLILADVRTEEASMAAAASLSAIAFNLMTLGSNVDVIIRHAGLIALAVGVALMARESEQDAGSEIAGEE